MDPDSGENIIFVTPEKMMKPENQSKVKILKREKKPALNAIDEAHPISEWADFRHEFLGLKDLKSVFCDTLLMAPSAIVTSNVEERICSALRNPVIQKKSINQPNITLNVEELCHEKGMNISMQFAIRAAELAGKGPAIIYTDFICDNGPILSSLHEIGTDAERYH